MSAQLGLGLAALGRPGYINIGHAGDLDGDYDVAAMERRCHAMLDAAWAAGVRWFDTARSYGRAEEFLASWLRARGAAVAAATVSSKWGYTYTAGWQATTAPGAAHEVKDHSRAALDRQWAETQALLGDGRVRLYQIHSATLETGVLDDAAVLARLAELREAGVAVGLSLSGARQRQTLERALAVEVGGRPLFSAVQATWNLLERAVEPGLRAAKAAGWTVIVKETLANGRLTARGEPAEMGALAGWAATAGVTPDAVALAAALAQPWADVVLTGAATPAQLGENVRARAVDGAAAAAALAGMALPAEEYWSRRSRLAWT
jgi:aryl-alcohol dehydrogenase-like predicted oxidoreductase